MSEKFALIAAEKADPTSPYPVNKMCVWRCPPGLRQVVGRACRRADTPVRM